MAKEQTVRLWRYFHTRKCKLSGRNWAKEFCWDGFKRINPALTKGLRKGKTRKFVRTQLKNGFKLEIA